ncbi:MAG: RdgB/HAM1 family non-canonical purine NTP pyrophosphatase [Tepidiformaceae bacterium]|tara:strand:+ start:624 stop:1244 length:621 start_codon:yes stop_codon:yes gene_type:complete
MDPSKRLDVPLPSESLLLATNNPGKLREITRLLNECSLSVFTPKQLNISLDVLEDGSTYSENAFLKAHAFAKAGNCLALADDSGLEVDALGGKPGLFSARYGSSELNDLGRVQLMLRELEGISDENRNARYVAAVIFVWPCGSYRVFEETWEGSIARSPIGTRGFGYDPIFVTSDGRTSAQLSSEEKDEVSHRGKAIRAALQWLVG